jgi:hypothetical protein
MFRSALGKTLGFVGYTIQYGCVAHCAFEYIGEFVAVCRILFSLWPWSVNSRVTTSMSVNIPTVLWSFYGAHHHKPRRCLLRTVESPSLQNREVSFSFQLEILKVGKVKRSLL